MNNSDKLRYIQAYELEGEAPLSDAFAALGRSDSSENDDTFTKEHKYDAPLRTTSIRVNAQLLEAFDAVAKRFDFTRNDAMALAMETFFDASINGYAYGCAQTTPEDGNAVKAFLDARSEVIKSLECDVTVQGVVLNSTHNDAMKKAKDFMNVAD